MKFKATEVERTLTRYNMLLNELMEKISMNEEEAFERVREMARKFGECRQVWVWFCPRGEPQIVAEEPFEMPHDREGEWILMSSGLEH